MIFIQSDLNLDSIEIGRFIKNGKVMNHFPTTVQKYSQLSDICHLFHVQISASILDEAHFATLLVLNERKLTLLTIFNIRPEYIIYTENIFNKSYLVIFLRKYLPLLYHSMPSKSTIGKSSTCISLLGNLHRLVQALHLGTAMSHANEIQSINYVFL